jgi:hypothetical protein
MPYREYPRYEQRLNAACYIVIAYLSGMRDSEVNPSAAAASSSTPPRTVCWPGTR